MFAEPRGSLPRKYMLGEPPFIWVDVFPSGLRRADWLTAYTAEMVVEDALRAGRPARLEIRVAPEAGSAGAGLVEDTLGGLRARGIEVNVHLAGQLDAARGAGADQAA